MAGMQITKQSGRDMLVCRKCAAEFPEGRATKDGWHYECPECGEGSLQYDPDAGEPTCSACGHVDDGPE